MAHWVATWTPSHAAQATYRKIYDGERFEFRCPKGLERDVDTFEAFRGSAARETYVAAPEAYVAAIPDGYVCGEGNRYNAVMTSGRARICDVCSGDAERRDRSTSWTMDLPSPTFISESAAVLVDRPNWVHPYFHWMLQVLPRIHLLKESGIPIDKYVMNARRSSFQYETLATLGLDEASIIEVDDSFNLGARELVVASVPHVPMPALAWVCAFLRSVFLDPTPARGEERFFISRATALRGRTVTNEDQVMEVLAKFGFRKFVPDQVSVAKQAELFASASAIVGPHGSALTNLVFCSPETKVVELFAPKYVHPVYWMLSSQCDLDYHYLVGKGERSSSWAGYPKEPDRFGLDPIEIDPDQLLDILAIAGL
jgi:glycosyl transferase family 61